jgi:hypothetical protein
MRRGRRLRLPPRRRAIAGRTLPLRHHLPDLAAPVPPPRPPPRAA